MKKRFIAFLFLTLTITAILCGCSNNSNTGEQGLVFALNGDLNKYIITDFVDADKLPANRDQIYARYTHNETIQVEKHVSLMVTGENDHIEAGGYCMVANGKVDAYIPIGAMNPGEYTARVFLDEVQVYEMPITVIA